MIEWRPQGPLVFGLELRRLTTDYSANQFTVTHLNVAAGWRW
jgi:hypothetical protein